MFEEIHVNVMLYILVFGESLLNGKEVTFIQFSFQFFGWVTISWLCYRLKYFNSQTKKNLLDFVSSDAVTVVLYHLFESLALFDKITYEEV